MAKKPKPFIIPRDEWDFSSVPDPELETCVIYEYARECVPFVGYQLKRSFESKTIKEKELANNGTARKVKLLREILALIQAEGFDEERFLENYYDTDCGYALLYDFLRDNITPFSSAWATLPEDVRASLCEMTKSRMEFFPPLKIAYVEHLEQLWTENSKELIAARERYKGTKYEEDDGVELFAETKPLLSKAEHGGETHGKTIAAFAVDFRRHSNATILKAFSAWLKENRPAECPELTRAGKKRADLRFDLKCLGVMRLLHWFTFDEINRALPEVSNSNQFQGNKWLDANKWYDARRHTMKTYHEIFPFLNKNEEPLNYQTAGERKKRGLPPIPAKWSGI
jgi:hypothetical protein